MTDVKGRSFAARHLTSMLIFAALTTISPAIARAMEVIPSLGITKSTDTNAGDAQGYGGLALRAPLLPFLKLEGGIGYRQDSFSGGDLKVKQWPLTASLWVTPLPILYAGGGLGWYRTTLDFDSSLPQEDVTSMETGVHLGGGLAFPVAPRLSLDLNGRYIFMQQDNDNVQVPTTFDPDFWTTSLGLAIQF